MRPQRPLRTLGRPTPSQLRPDLVFHGDALSLTLLPGDLAELRFDRRSAAVNKFDALATAELGAAVDRLAQSPRLRGVLVTSAKESFIVGADIAEFEQRFRAAEDELARSLWHSNEIFMAFEDLPMPSVAAINGPALGGGCELALAAAFRVMAEDASIGVPEVHLGLFPGFGGTVRLPRVGGVATAIDWIVRGAPHSARDARAAGLVDATCPGARLRETALQWLHRAGAGELDWRTRQAMKRASVPIPPSTHDALFACADATAAALPEAAHQPAARRAVALMRRTTLLPRDAAQWAECEAFARIARTQAGRARVQAFVDERAVRRIARDWAGRAPVPLRVALRGALELDPPLASSGRLVIVDALDADLVLVPGAIDADRSGHEARAAARLGAAVRLRIHGPAGPGGLVEVVRGPLTADAATARAVAFVLALDATPIVLRSDGATLVERVLQAGRSACTRLIADGVAPERLHGALRSVGWAPERCAFLPTAAATGACAADPGGARPDADLAEHVLLALVVAAAAALEDGVVGSASEVDAAVRRAVGVPAHLGGPLAFADWLGAAQVVERLGARASDLSPPPALRAMALAGRRYHGALP